MSDAEQPFADVKHRGHAAYLYAYALGRKPFSCVDVLDGSEAVAYREGMIGAQDVAALLAATGWTQTRLANEIGVTQATVSRWIKGSIPEPAQQAKLATMLARLNVVQPPEGRTVPVVGYVGAGAAVERIQSTSDGELDRVPAPEGSSASTVAVEIRGESLGSFFDTWLVYYDEVYDPPTTAMVGKVCVCGLTDGRVLIKKLKRGSLKDSWTLLSQFEPPIYDVFLDWAAVVRTMEAR